MEILRAMKTATSRYVSENDTKGRGLLMLMKRFVAILLVAVLGCILPAAAAGESLDLTFVKEYPELYRISDEENSDEVIIDSTVPPADRTFDHKYASTGETGCRVRSGICLTKEDDGSWFPLLFMYFDDYTKDAFLEIGSVTFVVGEKEFTFSDFAYDKELVDGKYYETFQIFFGNNNIDFIAALADLISTQENEEQIMKMTGEMILHGKKDVTVILSGGFYYDAFLLLLAMSRINGFEYFEYVEGTPMKSADVLPEKASSIWGSPEGHSVYSSANRYSGTGLGSEKHSRHYISEKDMQKIRWNMSYSEIVSIAGCDPSRDFEMKEYRYLYYDACLAGYDAEICLSLIDGELRWVKFSQTEEMIDWDIREIYHFFVDEFSKDFTMVQLKGSKEDWDTPECLTGFKKNDTKVYIKYEEDIITKKNTLYIEATNMSI